MAFTVVYDACVLYPAPLRDFLIRLARTGLFRAKWTDDILDECFNAIVREREDLKIEDLARTRELMNAAVEDCLVTGYEDLVDSLDLPDADDRHVLAAAIRSDAQVIVTFNLGDFPAGKLAKYNIDAKHPDDFARDVLDLSGGAVTRVVIEQAADLKNPPHDTTRSSGQARFQWASTHGR